VPKTTSDTRKLVKTKHAGIFEKGDRYQVRYRHHGRQVAKSFRTLSEAKRFKGTVDSGEARPSASTPFKTYATEWLDSYKGRTSKGLTQTTKDGYRDAVERLAIPYFGTKPLDRIGAPELRKYIDHLATKVNTPNSVRAMYAPVRAMFATATDDGLLPHNPAAGVRVLVEDKRPEAPKYLTAEQTAQLLAAIPPQHSDLVYLLATTGLRISESLNLRWADLTLVKGSPTLTVRESKTEAGRRTISLTPEAMRRLVTRRAKATYGGPEDFVFATRYGTPVSPNNWRRQVFDKATDKVGVSWATPHKLRHGMASLMASQGVSASEIAAHLGHADGGVLAMRTYIHSERVGVDFIDDAIKG
jgi:integrase